MCTHTYIYNWSLQPSQDYDLASHNTHVVCVNFILEWRDLQFNVDSEGERKSPKKYFFVHNFVLMLGLGYEPVQTTY